jgi:hypothetical protein
MAIIDVQRVVQHIIDKRSGQLSHGDPLYKYKIDLEELENLKLVLRNVSTSEYQNHIVCKKAIVLYASAWWTYSYQGGHWAWDPIFESIGPKYVIDPQKRSDYIRAGLKCWGQEPITGTRAFLGAIVYNGGIPNHLLTTDGSTLSRVLSRIIRTAPVAVSSSDVYERLAERFCVDLAPVYQQSEFYTLIANLLWELKVLLRQLPATPTLDPVAVLDTRIPGWRDNLPIVLQSSASRELINHISGNMQGMVGTVPFPVSRVWLHDDGSWLPQIMVLKRSKVKLSDLYRQFGQFSGTPKAIEVSACNQISVFELYRDFAVDGQYHVKGRDLNVKDVDITSAVSVTLRLDDNSELNSRGNQFRPIDASQIWRITGDLRVGRLTLQSVGPFSTRAESALVSIPADSEILPGQDEALTLGGRPVFQVNRSSVVRSADGSTYGIGIGDDDGKDEDEDQYELVGATKSEAIIESSIPIFADLPRVTIHRHDGSSSLLPVNKVSYGVRKAKPGVSRVRVSDKDNVVWAADFLHFPRFSVTKVSDLSSKSVTFEVFGLDTFVPSVEDESIEYTWQNNQLVLTSIHGAILPPFVVVNCQNEFDIGFILKLSCPLRNPIVTVLNGALIVEGATISLGDLATARLHADLGVGTELIVVMAGKDRRLVLSLGKLRAGRNDISLGRIWESAELLLSSSDELDSDVTVRLELNDRLIGSFSVGRYGNRLIPDRETMTVSLTSAVTRSELSSNAVMKLVSLMDPSKVSDLCMCAPNIWHVDLAEVTGPSIIAPSVDSNVSARPLLWAASNNDDEVTASSKLTGLSLAICVPDRVDREQKIIDVLSEMAGDSRHSDWATCNNLLNAFAHLPLSTLDFVRLSLRVPQFLVMMIFNMPEALSSNIIPRLEIELPFVWEMIPMEAWRDALNERLSTIPQEYLMQGYKSLYDRIYQYAGIRTAVFSKSQHTVDPLLDWTAIETELLVAAQSPYLNNLRIRMVQTSTVTPRLEGLWLTKFRAHDCLLRTHDSEALRHVIAAPIIAAEMQSLPESEVINAFNSQATMILKLFRKFDAEWYDFAFGFCIEKAKRG